MATYYNDQISGISYNVTSASNIYQQNSNAVTSTTTAVNYDDILLKQSNIGSSGSWMTESPITNEISDLTTQIEKISKALKDYGILTFDNNGNIIFKDKEKENKEMNTNDMFNFDFGALNNSKIRMSMYGYAIPNSAGKYVSYDIEHNRMMDVQILNFNCSGLFYKMPKPLGKIVVGDVVFHNGIPMFVREISEDRTRFVVIDPNEGTEKTILPAHSPFGFDYLTVLVSVMDSFDVPADANNPFGNMLPLLLLGNSNSADNLLPLMLMSGGKFDFDNPLMLLTMTGGNFDTSNPLVLMAMMKAFKNN